VLLLKSTGVTIGQRVKKLRSERGVSQDQLAAAAGVAQSAVSKLERDQIGDPGAVMLAGIADRLGVTIDELIGRERLAPRVSFLSDDPKPPAAPADRLRAIEVRVDLLTRALRQVVGDQLDDAIRAQAERDRQEPTQGRTGS